MINAVTSHFTLQGTLMKAERFGSGLINDTYLCEFGEGGDIHKYILQRINATVFRHPEQVMENVEVVTTHIVSRLRAEGVRDPYAITPALIPTRYGRPFHRDDSGAYWRMLHYIEAGIVFDTVKDARHACEVGRGLGRFQSLVSDLPPERLHDTLPGFHHTPEYLKEFDDVVHADVNNRATSVNAEIAFVSRRRSLAPVLTDLMNSGRIPVRVVHNDPKVNNVLIHTATGEALCMIDLDTVKPGIVHFDFGDCVRSATNPAGEDAEDLSEVGLDLPFFEAVARGYLREAGDFLTEKEIEMLPASVMVITFELGLRFLIDYLRGDSYFRIKYPEHNLYRARVQFKLLESIEKTEEDITDIVKKAMDTGD
ncbi:MAG: phosphotransferase enzyme family protein [Nitrospirota bacterium]